MNIVMELFRRKPKHALSDILKGLQNAVNSVQEMLQTDQIQRMQKFWQESDGSPICRKIRIGNKEIDVPLASLVSHKCLEMDEMEVNIKARISDIESHSLVNRLNGTHDMTYAELNMVMGDVKLGDNNVMDITIRFKLKDNPAGLTQLTDYYNKNIK